jgi:error-prone DNA polymerase
LLWELGKLIYQEEGLDIEIPAEPVTLPALGRAERLGWEVELLRLTPGDHVVGLHREALWAQGVLSSGELEGQWDDQTVRVVGLVVVRQPPPIAKGHVFITLEDEEGLADLIVRSDVYQQYRGVLQSAPLLRVEGRLQREGHTLSVLVHKAAVLGHRGSCSTGQRIGSLSAQMHPSTETSSATEA